MRRSPLVAAAALSSALVLPAAAFEVAGCSSSSTSAAPPGADASPDTGSDTSTTPQGDAATDGGLVLITDPDQGMGWLYTFIGTATKSIDLTMYELSDPMVTTLLTQAAANGITVRVILDQNLEMQSNAMAYSALMAGGVQVHWANPTYASTHQKTMTIDGATSAVMSMNLTPDDYMTSRDFAIITTDAADVAAIETVFAQDFVNASVTPPTGDDLVWSPTNAKSALVGLIAGATGSLYVENEEMSDDAIVEALSNAAKHGVDVNVIMENSESYQTEFAALKAAGVSVVVYRHAALYIHAKVVLSDFGSASAKGFVGSENFTNPSLTENRELGLVTTDPAILAALHATLLSDYDGGTPFQPMDGGAFDAGPLDAGDLDAPSDDAGDDGGETDAGTD
jgi:phosphatidylserine/phosphatidylglycerophosphate/cardiolipin synthase-like enzyme